MSGRENQPPAWTVRLLQRDRLLVALSLGIVCALAAIYTIAGIGMPMSAIDMTAMSGMTDMPGLFAPGAWTLNYAIFVFLMWWIMMIAMMLPSAAPTVLLYSALAKQGAAAASRHAAAFVAGYLAIWALFSFVATGLQWGLESVGWISATMMAVKGRALAAGLLIAAGIYQFAPVKQACLKHCRSPMHFLIEHRRPGASGAFRMGLQHGAFCAGCCVFLMALLFVGGIMNLYWIVGVALLVALEKLAPFGQRLTGLVGVALIVAGIYVFAAPLLA